MYGAVEDGIIKEGGAAHSAESRFNLAEQAKFENSVEGKDLKICFFVCALCYMWPYQTLLQSQNFLDAEFPELRGEAGLIMMCCTTWPLFIWCFIITFTGLGRTMSYRFKMVFPAVLIFLVALVIIVVMAKLTKELTFLYCMYAAALIVTIGESIAEPAVYDMAGLMPSALTSQAVQAGNGACGVIVCLAQILTRLIFNGFGDIGRNELESLTYAFFVLMAFSGIVLGLVYIFRIRPSYYYQSYVEHTDAETNEQKSLAVAVTLSPDEVPGYKATMEAFGHVWPTMLAVTITFALTLVLWPVMPGLACVESPRREATDHTLQSWWLDIILLTFNVADALGKMERHSLEWGARVVTPMLQLALACLRIFIFAPILFCSSAPQSYSPASAKWVIITSVFFLGLSNGWLSTVCFMRAPKALPANTSNVVAEQASTLLVLALFCGLSVGTSLAYVLGKTVLAPHLGNCYVDL